MTRWLFPRDVNMTLNNVLTFLNAPSIVNGAGNPAARPSAFQDWGIWNMEEGHATDIGKALKNGDITWQECVLLLLSKRSSQTEIDDSVKPLVVLCKAMIEMKKYEKFQLSKASCAKYLIPINEYTDIPAIVRQLVNDSNPSSETRYLDIWFNAFVESKLFFYPLQRGKDFIEIAHTKFANLMTQFIAIYGDKISGTPAKDYNKTQYYRYLGSMSSGLIELINPLQEYFNAFPDFCHHEKSVRQQITTAMSSPILSPYLAAIRTKPFLLLAGISGTGKSRLVRQLAKATAGDLSGDDKPGNFELIPVKPNWHDSTELLGYVSRISGHPEYVMTDFVLFLFKATLYPEIPFFLCLDEMNLAPVEQYFAEYLSVIETRKRPKEDSPIITTDVLVRFDEEIYQGSVKNQLEACYKRAFGRAEGFEEVSSTIVANGGLRIPSNLVVIGTVNMDETTFSFSRKVLDRAMSFELNVVDMHEGVQEDNSSLAPIPASAIFQTCLNAHDVFKANPNVANAVIGRLEVINNALDNTPFKIAYRSRNEIMIYVCERLRDLLAAGQPDEEALNGSGPFHQAMDEAISMKILSRIEGDEQRISRKFLEDLENAIKGGVVLSAPENGGTPGTPQMLYPVCSAKIKQMQEQLTHGYVSFWS